MPELITLPYCKVVLMDDWKNAPVRYFAGHSLRSPEITLLGHAVMEEFGTISSPVFICHPSNIGKIYNFGISVAHKRDPELPIESGWPPVCVGCKSLPKELPQGWESELWSALMDPKEIDSLKDNEYSVWKLAGQDFNVAITDAPLLPRQLRRLSQRDKSDISIWISIANKLRSPDPFALLEIQALTEPSFQKLLNSSDS